MAQKSKILSLMGLASPPEKRYMFPEVDITSPRGLLGRRGTRGAGLPTLILLHLPTVQLQEKARMDFWAPKKFLQKHE